MALEKLARIESQDSEEEQFSWPESEGEKTEVQERKEKRKQRKERIDRIEEEEIEGQEEDNGIEGVEEGSSSFSLVVYSVGSRNL